MDSTIAIMDPTVAILHDMEEAVSTTYLDSRSRTKRRKLDLVKCDRCRTDKQKVLTQLIIVAFFIARHEVVSLLISSIVSSNWAEMARKVQTVLRQGSPVF